MGFGSYDESEQENQDVDADIDDDGVKNSADHDGDVEFNGMNTSDLIDKLDEMKEEEE